MVLKSPFNALKERVRSFIDRFPKFIDSHFFHGRQADAHMEEVVMSQSVVLPREEHCTVFTFTVLYYSNFANCTIRYHTIGRENLTGEAI
jgi:hypothetical protein